MGFLFSRKAKRDQPGYFGITGVGQLIDGANPGGHHQVIKPHVNADRAMENSAVWAAVRLRADIISTLPLDVFRYQNGIQVEAPKTPVLVNPGGDRVDITEWLYSSQVELDRSGNSIGLIRGFDNAGYPTRIDLQPTSLCSVKVSDGELTGYVINGKDYPPNVVWHERQYTVSGLHVGLSPVAYAAWTLGEYRSVQEFAYSWFTSAGTPRSRIKNTEKSLDPKDAAVVKEAWRASQAMGEPFVHGSDWEYDLIQAEQHAADFVDAKKFSVIDCARYFGVPAELIDGGLEGSHQTYVNEGARNLQLLTLHLGPAIVRRERALSKLLPGPRFVKLNSDALLRLDPKTRADLIDLQLRNHSTTVTEARALDNKPPLTAEQMAEVMEHFPPKGSQALAA